jgi:hypothetical protein
MEFSRTKTGIEMASITPLSLKDPSGKSLLGDNREVMRHSSGAIHAALLESPEGESRMSLFGATEFGRPMERLTEVVGARGSLGASDPATDSNQNGVYVAYVQDDGKGHSGHVAHIPDLFGDPNEFKVHGPLTPDGGAADNSFLQASRAFNTVVYGWRDTKSGDVHVGVSVDGVEFPPAQLLVNDKHVVRGPAVGIHGEYVIVVYETTNSKFAPADRDIADSAYCMWSESGDAGKTWSDPVPLYPSSRDLPLATGFSMSKPEDLRRSELGVEGVAPPWSRWLQLLAWANLEDATDSRVFVLSTGVPTGGVTTTDWVGSDNSVGLLAFKPISVGGEWDYVVTNRSIFRQTALSEPYAGRTGTLYKYGALPGTRVRVITYVDRAPQDSALEDQLAILVSTNKGDSFDLESTFSASELGLGGDAELIISNSACCFADASGDIWQDLLIADARRPDSILHATMPIGLNGQGLDPTLAW